MGSLLCNSREGSSSQSRSLTCRRESGRTTTRSARHSSTSRSTWRCTPAMSTSPWRPTSAKFFKDNSNEERDHAIMFMDYQSSRGGRVVFQDIAKPTPTEWGTPLEAVEAALELEKTVNQSLLDLVGAAEKRNDPHLGDFIEEKFLDEQVKAIQQLSELVSKMKRAGVGLGVHIIDKEMA